MSKKEPIENIVSTCKECSDKKYEDFINNNGVEAVQDAYKISKELYVKCRFEEGIKVEHMWVKVSNMIDGLAIGTLANDPVFVTNIKCGDSVHVSLDAISNFIADDEPFMELIW